MSVHYGYAGKVLKIDLCSKTVSEYPWRVQDREENLGGKIMAARILRDHLTGNETAFSEENWAVIATGPLTGTGAPGSVRFDIAALSPKDDLPAFSNCGGNFGVYLKKAGYDALILAGRSEEKCWLELREDRIAFHDAKELWGTETGVCQQKLEERLGTNSFGRLIIGPAGENLVKFASVVSDGHSAGRAGIGAVLGWKNLKAITVSGNKAISFYAAEAAEQWNRQWYADLRASARGKENSGKAVCPGCPLHCSKHLHGDGANLLNALGMDAIAAEDAVHWAQEQGILQDHLYEDIAFRRGIGAKLADGVPRRKGKGGKRRGGSYGAIMEAFHLSPEEPETDIFCRSLTEAISAAGQCMFTVNGLHPSGQGETTLPVLEMLTLVTGIEMNLEKFLRVGQRFSELEQQILEKIK